jgi:hypothetical protein
MFADTLKPSPYSPDVSGIASRHHSDFYHHLSLEKLMTKGTPHDFPFWNPSSRRPKYYSIFRDSGQPNGRSQNKAPAFGGQIRHWLWRIIFNYGQDNTPSLSLSFPESASTFRAIASPDSSPAQGDNVEFVVETIGDHAVGLGGSSDVWKGRMIRDMTSNYSLVSYCILFAVCVPIEIYVLGGSQSFTSIQ